MNGLLIRDTRLVLSIGRKGLAASLGVSPTFLSDVERLRAPVPSDWEQKLTRAVPEWEATMRSCIRNKYPELLPSVPSASESSPWRSLKDYRVPADADAMIVLRRNSVAWMLCGPLGRKRVIELAMADGFDEYMEVPS